MWRNAASSPRGRGRRGWRPAKDSWARRYRQPTNFAGAPAEAATQTPACFTGGRSGGRGKAKKIRKGTPRFDTRRSPLRHTSLDRGQRAAAGSGIYVAYRSEINATIHLLPCSPGALPSRPVRVANSLLRAVLQKKESRDPASVFEGTPREVVSDEYTCRILVYLAALLRNLTQLCCACGLLDHHIVSLMSDFKSANGSTGLVWKMAKKRMVEGRPARQVCTVASVTGPAAAGGRSRGGDKLVAVHMPKRVCVVDLELARIRQLLAGKAGEPVILEFLRAAEVCPSEEALLSPSFGRPRNTFTTRLIREPIVDYKFVERSHTVGVKPIEDLYAERKLAVELDRAYEERARDAAAKNERRQKRLESKATRKEKLIEHAEEVRRENAAQEQAEFEAQVAKAREKVDAKKAIAAAKASALLAVLQSPTSDSMMHTTELYLNDAGMICLPPFLRQLTSLTCLHLSNNRLGELPAWLGDLTNLETLALGNNQLRELPTEMSLQTCLKHLDVRLNLPFSTPPQMLFDQCPPSKLCTGYIVPSLLLDWLRLCHGSFEDEEEDSQEEEERENKFASAGESDVPPAASAAYFHIRQPSTDTSTPRCTVLPTDGEGGS